MGFEGNQNSSGILCAENRETIFTRLKKFRVGVRESEVFGVEGDWVELI